MIDWHQLGEYTKDLLLLFDCYFTENMFNILVIETCCVNIDSKKSMIFGYTLVTNNPHKLLFNIYFFILIICKKYTCIFCRLHSFTSMHTNTSIIFFFSEKFHCTFFTVFSLLQYSTLLSLEISFVSLKEYLFWLNTCKTKLLLVFIFI